jgi:hypothetical protein
VAYRADDGDHIVIYRGRSFVPCAADSDLDGSCDDDDNCPELWNPGQEDFDDAGGGRLCPGAGDESGESTSGAQSTGEPTSDGTSAAESTGPSVDDTSTTQPSDDPDTASAGVDETGTAATEGGGATSSDGGCGCEVQRSSRVGWLAMCAFGVLGLRRRPPSRARVAAVLGLSTASCTTPRNEEGPTTSASGTSSGQVDTGESTFAADDALDPLDDTATAATQATAEDGGPPAGCTKADLLFVIDNSGSMADEQQNLIASFAPFITAVQETLTADDFHIMVVDTDSWPSDVKPIVECDGASCTCTPGPFCCEEVCSIVEECNGGPCQPPDLCEKVLGAGKVADAHGSPCLSPDGARFISNATDDLAGTFACLAEVGTAGSGMEQPMAAMLAAVYPGLCNEGFLREDAVLIVTFITDEDDVHKSPGTPNEWAEQLVEAKMGDPGAVVVLGLFGDSLQPDGICELQEEGGDKGAQDGFYLRQFVKKFDDRGLVGSVCAPDYGAFFEDAVGIIDAACDAYVPPQG